MLLVILNNGDLHLVSLEEIDQGIPQNPTMPPWCQVRLELPGLDPIDVLTRLRAEHDHGSKNAGINVFTGNVMDAVSEGVIEPLKIKTQALSSAAEVAEMILRIDDVIASAKSKGMGPPPGGPGAEMPESE